MIKMALAEQTVARGWLGRDGVRGAGGFDSQCQRPGMGDRAP